LRRHRKSKARRIRTAIGIPTPSPIFAPEDKPPEVPADDAVEDDVPPLCSAADPPVALADVEPGLAEREVIVAGALAAEPPDTELALDVCNDSDVVEEVLLVWLAVHAALVGRLVTPTGAHICCMNAMIAGAIVHQ
jgi:hypothetical protein